MQSKVESGTAGRQDNSHLGNKTKPADAKFRRELMLGWDATKSLSACLDERAACKHQKHRSSH